MINMELHSIVARARSISGVGLAGACDLFFVPDLDAAFAAHESEDGTIFVTRISVRFVHGSKPCCPVLCVLCQLGNAMM